MLPLLAPTAFADADFTSALRHGYQHYIHNTDTSDKKGNGGDPCEEQGHGAPNIVHCIKHIRLIADIIGIFIARGLQKGTSLHC